MNQLRCRNCGKLFSGPVVDRAVGEGKDRDFVCGHCLQHPSMLPIVFEEVWPRGEILDKNDSSWVVDDMIQGAGVPASFYVNSRPRFSIEHSPRKVAL